VAAAGRGGGLLPPDAYTLLAEAIDDNEIEKVAGEGKRVADRKRGERSSGRGYHGGWRVLVHRGVRRFEKRHPNYSAVISRAISLLGSNPYAGERLSGRCSWLWRLRLGELRVIYEVRRAEKVVYIWRVGLRENIYEGLC